MMNRRWKQGLRREQGSALILTVVIMGVLGIAIAGLLASSVAQRRMADRHQIYVEEFEMAELVLNKAIGEISYALKKTGETNVDAVAASIAAPKVPGFEVQSFSIAKTGDVTGSVPAGEKWESYNLRRVTCRVQAEVKRTDARGARYAHPGVGLQQDVQITYLPLNVFGLFYDNDLEIHNGQSDFQETGRTHTNSNFYYGADGKKQEWMNYVTAAEHVVYGRSPKTPQRKPADPGVSDGTNTFFNGTSQKSSLVNNNVDHGSGHSKKYTDYQHFPSDSTWANTATDLWNGFVRDQDMGVAPLRLPWPEIIPSSEVIQPPAESDANSLALLQHKFCYKAGLLISFDGSKATARNSNGTVVDLTYKKGGKTYRVVSSTTFYDARENRTVRSFDIDMNAMVEANISSPNGIMYIQNTASNGVVRLVNAERMPGSGGLTIATPDPLYLQGSFNTESPRMSMLACDAMSVLSDSWSDKYSLDNSKKNWKNVKPAANGSVTINASIVTGNVPSEVDKDKVKHYSGGVENFFRFLEDWQANGKFQLNVKGSLINLFASRKATGRWNGDFQMAPFRNFNWDPALAGTSPPGAPLTFETAKMGWSFMQ